jgi:hypothetical protein
VRFLNLRTFTMQLTFNRIAMSNRNACHDNSSYNLNILLVQIPFSSTPIPKSNRTEADHKILQGITKVQRPKKRQQSYENFFLGGEILLSEASNIWVGLCHISNPAVWIVCLRFFCYLQIPYLKICRGKCRDRNLYKFGSAIILFSMTASYHSFLYL